MTTELCILSLWANKASGSNDVISCGFLNLPATEACEASVWDIFSDSENTPVERQDALLTALRVTCDLEEKLKY